MPTVDQLSGPYANFMIGPRPGPSVCRTCFNLTLGYDTCYTCANGVSVVDAAVPISYSIGGEQLHRALAGYKRLNGEVARRFTVELAAVLWRFLRTHEACVARAAGVEQFDLVTAVPSSDAFRDGSHPLYRIVGELVGPARDRYHRLLKRSGKESPARAFDPKKFVPVRPLEGQAVLLIDDMWTTGASVQSAAFALRAAGADCVATVVIGRHLNREWRENHRRLRDLAHPFDWDQCALCVRPRALPRQLAAPVEAAPPVRQGGAQA
jgi:predicted amidophosphoribosyltransferase